MPMRGMDIRAVTAVGGTTAAAAFGAVAAAVGAVAATVAEVDGDEVGVAGAIARTFLDVGGRRVGERPTPVAGMLASRTSTAAASRTRGPRLMGLCCHPSREGQRPVRGS